MPSWKTTCMIASLAPLCWSISRYLVTFLKLNCLPLYHTSLYLSCSHVLNYTNWSITAGQFMPLLRVKFLKKWSSFPVTSKSIVLVQTSKWSGCSSTSTPPNRSFCLNTGVYGVATLYSVLRLSNQSRADLLSIWNPEWKGVHRKLNLQHPHLKCDKLRSINYKPIISYSTAFHWPWRSERWRLTVVTSACPLYPLHKYVRKFLVVIRTTYPDAHLFPTREDEKSSLALQTKTIA